MHARIALLMLLAGAAAYGQVNCPGSASGCPATTLPAGVVGSSYNIGSFTSPDSYLQAFGSWSVSSGSLPPGLTLDPGPSYTDSTSGLLSGVPTQAGTFTFGVILTDGEISYTSPTLSITIATPLATNPVSLPNGLAGAAYPGATLTASGGTLPYNWSFQSSAPPGFILNGNGNLTGTPTADGVYNFTAIVTDANNQSATGSYSVQVNPGINVPTLPSVEVGVAYPAAQFTPRGSTGTINWAVASGSLPPGLSLNSSNGIISGMATSSGNYSFTVQLSDVIPSSSTVLTNTTGPLSITITQGPSINVPTLPSGVLGSSYPGATFTAASGSAPFSWSISSGSLPAGLSLSSTGTISGTPTAVGTSSFVVQLRDNANQIAQTPQLSINVTAPPINFPSRSLPDATDGVAYSQINLAATGGAPPLTYSVVSGSLPFGMTLSASGTITGTPTAAGNFPFSVKVQDSTGQSVTTAFQIFVVHTQINFPIASLPSGTVGVQYQGANLQASGGIAPLTFSLASGSLPPGLSLNSFGAIAGTPTAPGNYSFMVQVQDATQFGVTTPFSIFVAPRPLSLSTAQLSSGTVATLYPMTSLTANGGTLPLSFAVIAGGLPPGLSLSSMGTLSGTPTSSGTFPFTVQVQDASRQVASAPFSITINPPPVTLNSTPLPAGTVNTAYPGAQITGAGGVGGLTYLVISGGLPAGLSLNSTGAISGTPTATGTSQFTVQVQDSQQHTASAPFSITINALPLTLNSTPLPAGTVNTAYPGAQIVGAGGVGGLTYSVISGGLPAGLSLNSTGAISGTPTATGTSQFTVQVQDSQQHTASAPFSITINPPALTLNTTTLPAGTVNTAYPGAQVTATGGVGNLTYSVISGGLPAGLSLSSTGAISGTPTATGTSQFTVQVQDSQQHTASAPFSITVNPPALTLNSTPLPAGTVNRAYPGAQVTATGGVGGLTYSVMSGGLPTGLSLSSTGAISGTPTTTGTSQFTVQVQDSQQHTASAPFSITINPPALTLNSTPLPAGTVNTAYPGAQVTATGGVGGLTYSVISGGLPAGLSLSSSGAISGTPTATGTSQFTIQVQDSQQHTAYAPFSITVNPPALTLNSTPLPAGTVNTAYPGAQVTGTGGVGNLTYSVISGGLPAGLSLSSTGAISGTPTATGTSQFTVQVQDSQQHTASAPFSITINAPALTLNSTPLPAGTVGIAYPGAQVTATGGVGNLTYSVISGGLPTGLSLSSTGAISGTPTTTGTSQFTIQVQDAQQHTASAPFSITINPPALTLNSTPLPAGTINTAYPGAQVTATGGVGNLTYSVISGGLPTGLSLSSTGSISGTPTATGTSQFTIQVQDSQQHTASAPFSITINPSALTLNSTPLPAGTVNTAYPGTQITASGGVGNLTYSVISGGLPNGLSLSSTGAISGTPTTTGTSQFTIQVQDAQQHTASALFSITINPPALTLNSTPLPAGTVNTAYPGAQVTATGGTSPITYAVVNGALPPGLSLSSTGAITGTPTSAGSSQFTVQARDASQQTASATFSITIIPTQLTLSPATLPSANLGVAYPGAQITATGGTAPITYSVINGALPAGLNLSSTGAITGAATSAGTSQFTVQARDASQQTASATFSISVNPAVLLLTAQLPAGTLGVLYPGAQITASAGTAPLVYTITSGGLPPGLTFSSSGAIAGTPTSAGTFPFTVQVRDANQQTASAAFAITINPAALTLNSGPLPNGRAGSAYPGAQIMALGGAPPLTYSITAGALPAGLSLNSSGAIFGTPTAAGTSQFTVQVRDANQQTASAPFSIVVTPAALTPGQNTPPSGAVSVIYQQTTLTVNGGAPPFQWVVTGGSLPPGLTLSPSGVLSGTPTQAGTFPVTVQVTDSAQQQITLAIQIVIRAAPLTVQPLTLPNGTSAAVYPGATLSATGGTPPYTWTLAFGALPPGLRLSSAGVISGTPTAQGSFPFAAQVTDAQGQTATGQFVIQVGTSIHISPQILPPGFVGVKYPATQISADAQGTATFGLAGGQLPPGLMLGPDGLLQGTPTQAGLFTFTVQATAGPGSGAITYIIRVSPGVTIGAATTLPACSPNVPYKYAFTASGGTAPYTWSVPTGLVPPGLMLSDSGVLSGACILPGTYTFTVGVTDSLGSPSTFNATVVVLPPLVITPALLPDGVLSLPYKPFPFMVTGGTAPYTWSLAGGTLPAGMSIDPGGFLTGTPTVGGAFSFTVKVTDSNSISATAPFTLNVTGGPSIQAPPIPDGNVGVPYPPAQFTATGGLRPYTWSSGPLPAGLFLSPAGVLAGTPSVPGTFTIQITVTDANGLSANLPVVLRIVASPLAITVTALPPVTAGSPVSQTLTVTGGVGPFVWSIAGGALPTGVMLSSDGTLTGTPTDGGSFTFIAQVTDNGQPGVAATISLTLQVDLPALSGITFAGLPSSSRPAQQAMFGVHLPSPYPLAIAGMLTLTFDSSAVVPGDDPAIQFLSGGRTLSFTIPANQTDAVFNAPVAGIQTGTVAGTITVTSSFQTSGRDITPAPAPLQKIVIDAAPAVITTAAATLTSTGVTVVVQGYATTRQIKSAIFQFKTGSITVDVSNVFTQWYTSPASNLFGSQFVYTQPFNVQGPLSGPVTVTLVNDLGNSNTFTAQF